LACVPETVLIIGLCAYNKPDNVKKTADQAYVAKTIATTQILSMERPLVKLALLVAGWQPLELFGALLLATLVKVLHILKTF
jgi:hypothetical protein